MFLQHQRPITYLITSGETTSAQTHPASDEFTSLLAQVEAAVTAHVTLIQLREKHLRPRVLYELAARAAEICRRRGNTRVLVNDRADIARAARTDGVHLTTQSLDAAIVRRAVVKGDRDFLIGVSTHTLDEARAARDAGANFAVFGPVFETPAKWPAGRPANLDRLNEATCALGPFPLLALGGITRENAHQALRAGAQGIAAIRLFRDARKLGEIVEAIEMIDPQSNDTR